MTIIHEASTGILTTVTDAAPYGVTWTGVGAQRMALLFLTNKAPVSAQPDLSSFADTWGLIGTAINATAGHVDDGSVNDSGLTRVTALYRVLTGAETGLFTWNTTVASNSGTAALSVYSTDNPAGWAVPIGVTGSDDTHAASRSCACGAWASALASGDLVSWGFASDTDTAITDSGSPLTGVITQSGATFGTTNYRNRVMNGTGADCGVYTFDAPVTAGNANAPTLTFATATSQCGAAIAVRLREAAPVAGFPPPFRAQHSYL